MKARLLKTTEEFLGNEMFRILTFQVPSRELKQNPPEICEISIAPYSPARNTDQNAKYWAIVSDIARLTGISKTALHNQLLNDYGELDAKDGEYIEIIMPERYNYLEDRDLHLFPNGQIMQIDGQIYNVYWKLKDSKELNRQQFSRLIDGAEYERNSLYES